MFPKDVDGSELVSLFVAWYVVVVREEDIVSDIETAFDELNQTVSDTFWDDILVTRVTTTRTQVCWPMSLIVRGTSTLSSSSG